MNPCLSVLALVLAFASSHLVTANTEKVIFIAPPAPPPVDIRALETLSPARPSIQKVRVELSFDKTTEEFFALEALDIGRKYEVRICWPASTPTQFELAIEPTNSTISPGGRIEERKGASKTFLRLTASPAFLSHRAELMESPPPVYFDLVLDPLVLGVLPESLVPVVGYACVIGVFAWLVIGKLVIGLIRFAVKTGSAATATATRRKFTGNRQKLE